MDHQKQRISGWIKGWKLAKMMFMQYILLTVWWVSFAAYLENGLKFSIFESSLSGGVEFYPISISRM